MSNNSPTILSIAPGTRELGVAVIQNTELLFYGVKTVGNRKSPLTVLEAVIRHIRILIEKYRPGYLAVKEILIKQDSYQLLAVVAEQIKATAKELKLPSYEYASRNVRWRLCQTKRSTKSKAAEVLVARFPELKRYCLRTEKWERDYYGNLFDAVAVSVICEEDLTENEAVKQTLDNQFIT